MSTLYIQAANTRHTLETMKRTAEQAFDREETLTKLQVEFKQDMEELLPKIVKNKEGWKDICEVAKRDSTVVITFVQNRKDSKYQWESVPADSCKWMDKEYCKVANGKLEWRCLVIADPLEPIIQEVLKEEITDKAYKSADDMAKKINKLLLGYPHKDCPTKALYLKKIKGVLSSASFPENMLKLVLKELFNKRFNSKYNRIPEFRPFLENEMMQSAWKGVREVRKAVYEQDKKMNDPSHQAILDLLSDL